MRWRILGKNKDLFRQLLLNRGLKTKTQQNEFLNPQNPYEISLRKVEISSDAVKKAISRIKKAIKSKEKIIIYGDYDADGVCSTAIVWETLDLLKAQVMPFIPRRESGYGLNTEKIDELAEEGVKLIITVDQGIVHSQQVAHAKKKGIDVIITDHHVAEKKIPRALAVIHTTKLAGVGVAWFFSREVLKAFKKEPKDYLDLDLVTIGTVTDMTPLLEANRSLVKFGLKKLAKTKRIGLQALFRVAGIDSADLGTYQVGFIIGPRINAAGRIKDSMEPLRLLCLRKDLVQAKEIARTLDANNRERQQLTKETIIQARQLWLKEDGQSSLIFVQDPAYHEGVIGLVAAKLKDEFYRPAVVVSQGKTESRASARSIEEFNIIEAIRACAGLLGSHGGHRLAAGFSVKTKKISLLKKKLQSLAEKSLQGKKLVPTLKIDGEIKLADLNLKFWEEFQQLAPFGMKNPQPVFISRDLKVDDVRLIGRDKSHLSLSLESAGARLRAVGFGMADFYKQLSPEQSVDVAYNLLLDQWSGRRRLQLKLKDIKIEKTFDKS